MYADTLVNIWRFVDGCVVYTGKHVNCKHLMNLIKVKMIKLKSVFFQ